MVSHALVVEAEVRVAPAIALLQIKIICTPATVVMGEVLPFPVLSLLMVVAVAVGLVKQPVAITAALITALLVKVDTVAVALGELSLQVLQILAYQELPILAVVVVAVTAFVEITEAAALVALV
jgi:hypothetical protein